MKTIPMNVYTIKELKGKAKEKAIEKMKDIMINFNFENFESDSYIYLSDELGINGKIYYSLSYSQGDGLRIQTPFFNTHAVINKLELDAQTKQAIHKLSESSDIMVSTKANTRRSYHSENVLVEFSQECENLLPSHMMENITNAFINVYESICAKLEKDGYACYEVNDEDCVEFAFDKEFFENGEEYNG
jgi:(p)ppGpp synthase/HD superfamily hydrolase